MNIHHHYVFLAALGTALLSMAYGESQLFVTPRDDGSMVFSDQPKSQKTKLYVFSDRANFQVLSKSASVVMNSDQLISARDAGISAKIRKYASVVGLPEKFVRAVIQVESGFDPGAISKKGAMGLMQLMPATAKQYNATDLLDPEENIRAGVAHLAYLHKKYRGDLKRVLAAYNAGEGAVAKYNGVPPYPETERYISKVFGLLDIDEAAPSYPAFPNFPLNGAQEI